MLIATTIKKIVKRRMLEAILKQVFGIFNSIKVYATIIFYLNDDL